MWFQASGRVEIKMVIEPFPYTQILPKCGNSYLAALQKEADNLFYEVEIESVAKGMRQVDIFHLFGNDYDTQLGKLADMGLVFLPIRRSKAYSGFSHRHFDTPTLDKDSMVFGAIAKDLQAAKKFKELEAKNDHIKMGELLGYPECCSRAFKEYIKRSLDPVYEIALNTNHRKENDFVVLDGIPFENIVHLRYFGFRVIPWLPCCFDCDISKEAAAEWIALFKRLDSTNIIEKVISLIKIPSTWSLYNAQIVVNKPPHKESLFFGYTTSCYLPGKLNVRFEGIS